jgi:uncharacterized ParB-like nuclease family protein
MSDNRDKKKWVYIDLNEIGVDPDRSQTRHTDLNTAKMGELRDSIRKIDLQEAITVTQVSGKPYKYEVVHGCHRFRAMRDINSTNPSRFGKVPCMPPATYADDNEMFEEQFEENLHLDKIHTPANKDDLGRHIFRLMGTGTFVSPYSTSGIVWDTNVFATPASRAEFGEELEAYMVGVGCTGTTFNKKARKWVVDQIFAANGVSTVGRIRKYTGGEASNELVNGMIPGFNGKSGNFERGTVVYTLNSTDGPAKIGGVIQKLIEMFGGSTTEFKCAPAKIVFAAHANGNRITTDKTLDAERKRLTNFVKEINNFFAVQFPGNPVFSKLVDELYFLPQKVNRGPKSETSPLKAKI